MIRYILPLLVLSLIFAGCGSDENSSSGTKSSNDSKGSAKTQKMTAQEAAMLVSGILSECRTERVGELGSFDDMMSESCLGAERFADKVKDLKLSRLEGGQCTFFESDANMAFSSATRLPDVQFCIYDKISTQDPGAGGSYYTVRAVDDNGTALIIQSKADQKLCTGAGQTDIKCVDYP